MKRMISIITLLFAINASAAEVWKLATLEYPPYNCEKCKDLGAMSKALTAAAKSAGIELKFEWLPWTRAINDSKAGKFVGYWPSWPEDCVEGFLISEPITYGPFGVVENKSKPLKYENTQGLTKYTIGSVQDYGNTKEFNELVKAGKIKNEVVVDDGLNLRKVAGGRLDGAVVDGLVMKHMLKFDMPEIASKVQFNSVVLENKVLGICFNTKDHAKLNAKLKEALAKTPSEPIVKEFLETHFK